MPFVPKRGALQARQAGRDGKVARRRSLHEGDDTLGVVGPAVGERDDVRRLPFWVPGQRCEGFHPGHEKQQHYTFGRDRDLRHVVSSQ